MLVAVKLGWQRGQRAPGRKAVIGQIIIPQALDGGILSGAVRRWIPAHGQYLLSPSPPPSSSVHSLSGSQEDRKHGRQLDRHLRRRHPRPLRNPPALPQSSPSPLCTQVLLRVHSHRRRLGHPRPVPPDMAAPEDQGMATTQDPLPLPPPLHAD